MDMAGDNKHTPSLGYGTLNSLGRPRNSGTNSPVTGSGHYHVPKGGGNKPSVFDFSVKTGICPTCQGTGRVTKAHSDQLVAIIPYSDKRLKRPRRCCCYFAVFLIVIIACAALILGLLFPRPLLVVPVQFSGGKNWTVINPRDQSAPNTFQMQVDVYIHLVNQNFAPVTVNTLNVTVYHEDHLVGHVKRKLIGLPTKTDIMRNETVKCNFTGQEASKVRILCDKSQNWTNQVMLRFEVTTEYTYIATVFQTEDLKYHYVHCDAKRNKLVKVK